jgi:hypothetical protein
MWRIRRHSDTRKEVPPVAANMTLTTMKIAIFCMVLASVAALSLSAPLSLDDSLLQSLSEALEGEKTGAVTADVPVDFTAETVSNTEVATKESSTPSGTRFVRIQSSQAYLQVSYVSVQTADGKVVSEGKSVSSSCGSCGYPAAPSVIVNGKAEARGHPGEWHGTSNNDWIEIDLGQSFHVAKVVFYNRADCCAERATRAILTLLDADRKQVDAAVLNGDMMQIFDFKQCSIDQNTGSYKNNHADHVTPILSLLCGLQNKIKNSQVDGQKQVAAANTVAAEKKAIVEKAKVEEDKAISAATTLANEEKTADVQKQRELEMIDKMVQMIHALNGKSLGNAAGSPVVDLSELVGRPSGWYFVQPKGESAAVRLFVDNERNGGGWALVARVTKGSCQAHITRSAVNIGDGKQGPAKDAGQTVKLSDSFIQNLRSGSSAKGTIGFWMEAQDFRKDVFISSQATVDLEGSANGMSQRTNIANSYSVNAALSQRQPNTGTRGFGDHHTSGGVFFAWGRHPEERNNCGFREDSLGSSDGYLWVR